MKSFALKAGVAVLLATAVLLSAQAQSSSAGGIPGALAQVPDGWLVDAAEAIAFKGEDEIGRASCRERV